MIREVCGMNRVLDDVTAKPPGNIEWSKGAGNYDTRIDLSFVLEGLKSPTS